MTRKEFEVQNVKRKIRKGGVCLLVTLGVMIVGVSGYVAYRASAETVPNKSDSISVDEVDKVDELFPSGTIPEEYEADNLYVQVNNGLINAVNDYSDGKITEEEYLAIVKELNELVDSEGGIEKMREDEKKFRELTEK